jgi:hypothetical protein
LSIQPCQWAITAFVGIDSSLLGRLGHPFLTALNSSASPLLLLPPRLHLAHLSRLSGLIKFNIQPRMHLYRILHCLERHLFADAHPHPVNVWFFIAILIGLSVLP